MDPALTTAQAEAEIAAKTAPKVTRAQIEARIREVRYVTEGTLTVAIATIENGFNVVGTSAAASPANFDAEIGKRLAFDDALDKMWALEGYLLREKLWRGSLSPVATGTPASPAQPSASE